MWRASSIICVVIEKCKYMYHEVLFGDIPGLFNSKFY